MACERLKDQRAESFTSRGINTRSTIFDTLVFSKIAAKLGGSLDLTIVGSAPIPYNIIDWYRAVTGAEVIEGYGQTESSAGAVIQPIGKYDFPHGSYIGIPYSCNEIKLVDIPAMSYFSNPTDPKLCPRGELCIRGENVMQGYWREDAKTKE
ncbi:Long-chain-fatty-acid--CoA ligase 5, partial [Gonapodya sp. JEL0774]